jgi:perosamine synthetase
MGEITHSKPWLTEDDRRAVAAVMDTGMIAEGDLLARFADACAAYLGAARVWLAACGTEALVQAIATLGIGVSDEVVIPTYACRAVWDAVIAAGANPVLCDAGDDWCINGASVRRVLTPRTRAIVVVHTFGVAAEMDDILALGLPVIEDCAQAFGARDAAGRLVGTRGVLAIYSFHATKCLTTGQGGLVAVNDRSFVPDARVELLRRLSPLSAMQAALGLAQLNRYAEFVGRRAVLARHYFAALAGIDARLPRNVCDRSLFFRFPLRVGRDVPSLIAQFARHGVHVRHGVDRLLHREFGGEAKDFPGAERNFAETLSIPCYPALADEEVERVIAAAQAILVH